MGFRVQDVCGVLTPVRGRREDRLERTIDHNSALSKFWPTQWEALEQRLPSGGIPHRVQWPIFGWGLPQENTAAITSGVEPEGPSYWRLSAERTKFFLEGRSKIDY